MCLLNGTEGLGAALDDWFDASAKQITSSQLVVGAPGPVQLVFIGQFLVQVFSMWSSTEHPSSFRIT